MAELAINDGPHAVESLDIPKWPRTTDATEKFRDIEGLDPLPEEDRITDRGYYFYLAKYDPEEFDDIPHDHFVEALSAEDVPAGQGIRYPRLQARRMRPRESPYARPVVGYSSSVSTHPGTEEGGVG